MRRWAVTLTVLTLCGHALPKDRRPGPALPGQFEIGRHTFIDVGPPNDFYELFLVRPAAAGTSIERITLTPAADACLQPAKLEVASASLNESVATLLGKTNPCTIREKELRRELKRCKKCLVFSGANVQMRVQCGAKTHIIRSDILDKDMFDPAPNTPEHTSWTMQLLARLDNAVGPGVMERPIFPISEKEEPSATNSNSEALADVSSGKFDMLFQGAPDKPSELYHAAQIRPPLRLCGCQAVLHSSQRFSCPLRIRLLRDLPTSTVRSPSRSRSVRTETRRISRWRVGTLCSVESWKMR